MNTIELTSLEGKRILITGGTTGIGRATAVLLAAQGANVLIVGRHESELKETLQTIQESGHSAHGCVADVSMPRAIELVFKKVDSQLGGIDVLINNAALAASGIMEEENWRYVIETNLMGYLACSREAIKRMKETGAGHLVYIGSMSADVREEGSSVYVATKAGIQGFTESLRKEVNPLGIKVSLIEPGAVATPMQPASEEEQKQKQQELEMLHADDIAQAVGFVLSQPLRSDIVNLQIRPHLQLI
ncbi:oxidoreductase [Siphonobacter sp. SORGH_AS_0500]|uniref:SDR family oxidoreductase n=1 Tax=Siphonobacter sp. SORGH_AS_0500 TaxID=1864824 RepID=UPI000CB791A9|nr:SDR family oxidoreductase [Siphonobacter sp. SORGH_AS_0500]PKK34994.1 oxidoreductase [Siphonobacter sp. SORGH_AS_0500]